MADSNLFSAGTFTTLPAPVTEEAQFDSNVVAGYSTSVVTIIQATVTAAVDMGDEFTATVDAGVVVESQVAFGINLGGSASADATATAQVLAAIAQGDTYEGDIDPVGSFGGQINLRNEMGVVFAAEVNTHAIAVMSVQAAQQAIGDALAHAGVDYDVIVNVTMDGGSLSGLGITPDCRRFIVNAEIRTFLVEC